ncbi:hypothetical protein EYF80_061285 [Liparis tanakae]|uniref:Secreted protein n=1 Tax=Liparis tanakae TaxID=230148 RepID=A0A4Z2EIE1_9TELE|nr:hypothetical protein EYF80_061285 [Liparis tanakae]
MAGAIWIQVGVLLGPLSPAPVLQQGEESEGVVLGDGHPGILGGGGIGRRGWPEDLKVYRTQEVKGSRKVTGRTACYPFILSQG